MSLLVDDIVVFPNETEPDVAEVSLSASGLSIVSASFGESVMKGTQLKTTVGSVLVDREPESRTITLRLQVRDDPTATLPEAVVRLEEVVIEMQERETWIRRDFHVGGEFGSILYRVTGEVTLGDFGGWQAGDSPDVALTLVCDFAAYSTEEEEHGPFETSAGDRQLIYELPESTGTTRGLKRAQVGNLGSEDWRGLIWSEECRDYSPGDPTALPHYEAIGLTPKGGAVIAGPAPEVRAVGTVGSGAGAIAPGLPSGTQIGDLLIMVAESGGPSASTEASAALTASGWTSPPSPYAPQVKGNTRLTVLYRIATGTDPTLTNDTGDHQQAAIIGIKAGSFNEQSPFNVAAVGTQAATKSVSVPGATTSRDNCLVLACASGNLPDAGSPTEFGTATNASLSALTERVDNTVAAGDGGALWVATGTKAVKGAYGATTCTAVTEAERAVVSLALNPPEVVAHFGLTGGKLVILGSEIAGVGHMTHRGPRKIWMRLEQPTGAVGDVKLRLLWRALGSGRWVEDGEIVSPYVVGDGKACLLDLGVCRPQKAVVGEERWEWALQAWAPGGSGSIRVRDVYALSTEQYLECSESYEAPVAEISVLRSPGTVENEPFSGSKPDWVEPGNAKASDNKYATTETLGAAGKEVSDGLRATNFGFAIPEGATIGGFVVAIERGMSGGTIYDYSLRMLRNGVYTGADWAASTFWVAWGDSDKVVTYGSSSDRWGASWTPSQVNSSDFGVALSVHATGSAVPRVDHISITVYYAEATGEDRVCFAGRSVDLASDGVSRQHQSDDVWGTGIPKGFYPRDEIGGPSRGILIATQGDLGSLPDLGENLLNVVMKRRAGHLYARPS